VAFDAALLSHPFLSCRQTFGPDTFGLVSKKREKKGKKGIKMYLGRVQEYHEHHWG